MEKLLQSLQTGFINYSHHSDKSYRPELLINDYTIGKKVLSTINSELRKSDEFWFSVAFLTEGGVHSLLNSLIEFREQGKKGKILVSQYLDFTQPKALRKLISFENLEVRILTEGNFHSKGYLFKKDEVYNLIIGSSNLTSNALSVNKELNIKFSASEDSEIIHSTLSHFQKEFEQATIVTEEFIRKYEEVYNQKSQKVKQIEDIEKKEVQPNLMQKDALTNLDRMRTKGIKKSLLISATGTGKTFLSAFDAKAFAPKKLLFVVHRANIAQAALDTFKVVFGKGPSMGLYSGKHREKESDFIFSTIQTISKQDHLNQFTPDYFDYIIIDETHRAGASSYQKVLDYFTPKFLLGMTATPERTDGLDIFKLFDHNIAYEIRLHRALAEDMLTPFHYYGVTDLSVNGEVIEKDADFALLTANERVDRIIEKASLYGYDHKDVRGLVFCSNIEECKTLSEEFNQRGYKSIALTGSNSEEERVKAINQLESDNITEKLDYIFTVDIFGSQSKFV